jgi:hypothetical protein
MTLWVLIYFVAFALIAGGAFAMMWGNIQSINKLMDEPPRPRHPEAPEAGEEVMYVDVSGMSNAEFKHRKDWLEDMYQK